MEDTIQLEVDRPVIILLLKMLKSLAPTTWMGTSVFAKLMPAIQYFKIDIEKEL